MGSTITGTPVSEVTDYAELATVKTELQIKASDTSWDAIISRMITEVSRLVDLWCNRQPGGFVGQTQTKVTTASKTTRVWLPEPIVSVTTLKTDENGDRTFGTTWASGTDYRLLPLEGPPYTRIEVDTINGTKLFPRAEGGVEIVGVWGEAVSVPEPIRRAVTMQIARLKARIRTPEGVAGSDEGGFIDIKRLDPDVVAILRGGGYRLLEV